MSYLVVNLNNGNEFVFDLVEGKVTLGRNARNDIVIENNYISSFHAELVRQDDESYEVTDLKSANGTFVNGDRIEKKIIVPGDIVRFGQLNAKFVTKRPKSKKEKGMTGVVSAAVGSPEKPVRSSAVSSFELLVDANGVTIPLPPPTAPLRPVSVAPILPPVDIQADTHSLVHVAPPEAAASMVSPKSAPPSGVPLAMQKGRPVNLRPAKPVGRSAPSTATPAAKGPPPQKAQPTKVEPVKEDKAIKLPPAFIPPPPEPVVPVSTKPGKPPKAGPPKRVGPPSRPLIPSPGSVPSGVLQGTPPPTQGLRPVARPPGSQQLPPPTQNLVPPIAQPVQRKQPLRPTGGPAQVKVIPPSRPAAQKPKAPSPGFRPPGTRMAVPMQPMGYGAPPANVTLVLNSPMMPGMPMMPNMQMMPNMHMMMPGMIPSMYGMPMMQGMPMQNMQPGMPVSPGMQMMPGMMPGMPPTTAPAPNSDEMLKQQQQLLAQQRDAFRAEMAGAESRLATVRAEINALEGEKNKINAETSSAPSNAGTNMEELIASIEKIKDEIAAGLASSHDEETLLIYVNDIIKRLDLIDILIQRYSSPDRDKGIEKKLRDLHAAFLTILTNYGVTAFIIQPGTAIIPQMSDGVSVVEEVAGPHTSKITECIHPGYVRVTKDGRQLMIRKLEVKASRSL